MSITYALLTRIAFIVLVALAVMLLLWTAPVLADDFQLQKPHKVVAHVWVTITHSDGDRPTIRLIDSGAEVDERYQVAITETTTAFTAPPGRYLVEASGAFGVVIIEGDQAEVVATVPMLQIPEGALVGPDDEAEPAGEVWFFTRPNCPPCDLWKAEALPALKAAGVKVYEVDDPTKSVPTFILRNKAGKVVERVGYSQDGGKQTRTNAEALLEYFGR